MMLKVIVLCCVLQLIAGAKIPNDKIQTQSISPRIVGGVDAAEGQAPYQCSLQHEPRRHFCGCAIISAEWIITAAHCLRGEWLEDIRIIVGTNQRRSGGTSYNAAKLIPHEKYSPPSKAFDIGLIRVQTPIEFNEKVQPIKYSDKMVKEGVETLQATGWGFLTSDGPIPENLQVLNVTSISNDKCMQQADSVHVSHLCTISPRGEGICLGDSGGPLVYGNELVGIVDWVIPCGLGSPDGFARISYLYDWIEKNVNSE